jgi:hypothetical protein
MPKLLTQTLPIADDLDTPDDAQTPPRTAKRAALKRSKRAHQATKPAWRPATKKGKCPYVS